MKVYVVTCEQHYANHFRVVAVFSTETKAKEIADQSSDYQYEAYEVDDR